MNLGFWHIWHIFLEVRIETVNWLVSTHNIQVWDWVSHCGWKFTEAFGTIVLNIPERGTTIETMWKPQSSISIATILATPKHCFSPNQPTYLKRVHSLKKQPNHHFGVGQTHGILVFSPHLPGFSIQKSLVSTAPPFPRHGVRSVAKQKPRASRRGGLLSHEIDAAFLDGAGTSRNQCKLWWITIWWVMTNIAMENPNHKWKF